MSGLNTQQQIDTPNQVGHVDISWDSLFRNSACKSKDPDFFNKVKRLKENPRTNLFKISKLFVKLFLKDPSHAKFANSSYDEVADIMAAQVAENEFLAHLEKENPENFRPILYHYSDTCKRTYNQQPCTQLTSKNRAVIAKKYVQSHEPILVLGDDDFVGLELARAGFTNVTVVDIDEQLLDTIRTVAEGENLQLTICHQDFNDPIPSEYKNDFRLVYLDPDYTVEGVQLFLNAARSFVTDDGNTMYFLSLHLMSLLKEGLARLPQVLDDMQLQLVELHPSFNSYPIPPSVKKLISLVNNTVTRSEVLRADGAFHFFVSDALVMQKKSG